MTRTVDEILREMAGAALREADAMEREFDAAPPGFRDISAWQMGIPADQHRQQFREAGFRRAGWGGPLAEELADAVLADDDLRRLFPYKGDSDRPVGFVSVSTGQGSMQDLSMFGGGLIELARMRLDGIPNWETYLADEIATVLDNVRTLARGEQTSVRIFTGFDGATLPSGTVIELPWGTLRSGPPPAFSSFERGDTNGQITLVYDMPATATITDPRATDHMTDPEVLRRHAEAQQRIIEATCLAVLFATTEDGRDPIGMVQHTSWIPSPLGGGGGGSGPFIAPAFGSQEIRPEDHDAIRAWATKVHAADLTSIEVAVRRTLSALHRPNLEDKLIDAVIALENLFGVSKGEQQIRVSHATALLLADGPDERRSLAKEVKDLYNERSSLVHGDRPKPSRNLYEDGRRAVALASMSMKALIESRPDLLLDRTRWSKLLLDLPPE